MSYAKGDGNVCGSHGSKKGDVAYNELRVAVACKVTLSGSGTRPLTVRAWTDLDSGVKDESFGIDNVVIQKIRSGIMPRLDPSFFHSNNHRMYFLSYSCPWISNPNPRVPRA